jgi:CheY-like chemotaxis protein
MKSNAGPRKIRTVLLIEDEEALARGMIGLLERHGFTVIFVKTGAEAIAIPLEHKVDLVITDIFMDGMDGLETLMHFKRTFPKIPVIAVSAGSDKLGVDCLRMAQHLGADRTFRKPILIAALLDAIRILEVDRPGGSINPSSQTGPQE